MLFIVSKVLQLLLWPLNLALLALGAGFFLRCREHARRNLSTAAFWILLLTSIPALTVPLRRHWEGKYPARPIAEYPTADAIVVLGGSVPETRHPRLVPEETSGARAQTGYRLFRAGKAPAVLLSGGVTYVGNAGTERVEADDLAELMEDWGVPKANLIRERLSRTTYENAVETARMLLPAKKKILLVTSALHMRRSVRLFEKQGFEVIAVPNSHHTLDFPIQAKDFIPDTDTFFLTTRWLKEMFGFTVYRILGKL